MLQEIKPGLMRIVKFKKLEQLQERANRQVNDEKATKATRRAAKIVGDSRTVRDFRGGKVQ